MKRPETAPLLLLAALPLLTLSLATPAVADDEVVRRVEIRTDSACDGADCPDDGRVVHKMIFLGEDGEAHPVGGGTFHWTVGEPGEAGDPWAFHHGPAGFLGIGLTPLTPELRTHFGVPEEAGVMVSRVEPDSPAARAGVEVGDIVTGVNGERVGSPMAVARAIRGLDDGAAALLELWRDGRVETLSATVEVRAQGFGGAAQRHVMVRCEEGEEDCAFRFHGMPRIDCGDQPCEVEMRCTDGGCECTRDGESIACEELHSGAPHSGD